MLQFPVLWPDHMMDLCNFTQHVFTLIVLFSELHKQHYLMPITLQIYQSGTTLLKA